MTRTNAITRATAAMVVAVMACWTRSTYDIRASSPADADSQQRQPIVRGRLRAQGTELVYPDGTPFIWRGITAFALVEMVAHGREQDAVAYLKWARTHGVTVVRVLTMASGLFELTPADGARALPKLLELALRHDLYVEAVALADTASYDTPVADHVREVAKACASFPNALLEIANEPTHLTQRPELADARFLLRLRNMAPADVPVSLGAGSGNDPMAGGDYFTVHFIRDKERDGWRHISQLAHGAALERRYGKPVVNDEPIGAGERRTPGSRETDPNKCRALSLTSRLAGIGATFHYEDGLHARTARPVQQRCFDAWNDAWKTLPADIEQRLSSFNVMRGPGVKVDLSDADVADAFVAHTGASTWVLLIGVVRPLGLTLEPGWKEGPESHDWGTVRLHQVVRSD